jgi:Pectate lyase superfamily protein
LKIPSRKSGSSTTFATSSGALTAGDCVRIDAFGNFVDSGSNSCGGASNAPHTQDFLAGTDFTAGTTTSLTLPSTPASTDLVSITFDGIGQNKNTWSLAGAVVTFNAAIPTNTQVVEAKWSTSSTVAGVGSIGLSSAPLNGAVTVSSLTGMISQAGQNIAIGLGNFLSGLANAVSRTVFSKLSDFTNIQDFGAVCNGTTDDTTAIQNAMNAVPSGGTLYLSNSLCAASSTILRTTPITIIGAGMNTSGFVALSGMPTTSPLFEILPPTGVTSRGYSFSNMIFDAPFGAAAVEVESAFSTTNLAEVVFDKVVTISTSANANNFGILLLNGSSPEGGIFNFTYKNGIISGGAFLVKCRRHAALPEQHHHGAKCGHRWVTGFRRGQLAG